MTALGLNIGSASCHRSTLAHVAALRHSLSTEDPEQAVQYSCGSMWAQGASPAGVALQPSHMARLLPL